jgi:asparagine synthase (glutamine-hydrolysing)
MCGIVGCSGQEAQGLVPRMLDRIRHRGPDDRGEYRNGRIHLGMVRLSILDLLGGRQPLTNEEGTVWAVFNGEIFNYVELRAELEAKGHRFATATDGETIIHAYEEHGPSFAHRLNGMFAIALWDTRSETLLLYRDRYGVKPLFYAAKADGLLFASEIKALLCSPTVDRELDYAALSHYFSLRNVPAPYTVFRGIRSLPPGHALSWNQARGMAISPWYELPTATCWADADEPELVDRIDLLLRDAVRLRLRSDVGYGAYLSGGIDSSTVVAIASQLSPAPLRTFTLAYADSPAHKRDSIYARQVAARFGTEHHEFVMSWTDLQEELATVIAHLDQPFAGVTSSFWLSRFMKEHVTVALSGDGADDLFGSYGHHRLVGAIAALRAARQRGLATEAVDLGFFNGREEFVAELAGLAPWQWRLAYGAFMEPEKEALLSTRGRELLVPHSTAGFLEEIYRRSDPQADELNKLLFLDINTLLANEILYFNDMLAMAHSMEVRTPFLDFRLVELACSIPGSLKIRNGQLKYILRRVAARYLPREILERPKEGFVLPKNTWLRLGMAPLLADVLSAERLALHGLLAPRVVGDLLARFLGGDETLTFKVWTLVVFQLWYEGHVAATGTTA